MTFEGVKFILDRNVQLKLLNVNDEIRIKAREYLVARDHTEKPIIKLIASREADM